MGQSFAAITDKATVVLSITVNLKLAALISLGHNVVSHDLLIRIEFVIDTMTSLF